MKKIVKVIMLMCVVIIGLTGCQNQKSKAVQSDLVDEKIKVVATIFPQYDFVREIAGDNVDLTMLLSPGAESHSYEPTPQDIITIQNCDVFIYVGGESDNWVEEILASMDTSNMKVISLLDTVQVLEEEIVEGMEEEDEDHEEEDEPEYDEHVWTDPNNVETIVVALKEMLQEVDSENFDVYEERTKEYCQKLKALDQQFQDVMEQAVRHTFVFGDRFPFRYFAQRYQLSYYAAFPGCATETEASAATIAFLIDKVKEENIPVVFHVEFSNEKIADVICESTSAKKLLLHSAHNVTRDEFQDGISYLSIMEQNVEHIKEALN